MLKRITKFLFKYATRHKIIAGAVVFAVALGGYVAIKAVKSGNAETRYVLAAVTKGTVISTVSGSGQVAVSNQVDIKPKVSGNIVYIGAASGKEVKAGALIAQIDSTDAQRVVRDARTSLETAKLELEELLQPLDELTALQAENSLAQLKESKGAAEDNLTKAYEDGFNAVVSSLFDLPVLVADMKSIIYGNDINKTQDNLGAYSDTIRIYEQIKVELYKEAVIGSYKKAYDAYVKNFDDYKLVSRYSDSAAIEALVNETYETSKEIGETFKDADNFISFVKDTLTEHGLDVPKIITTHQATIKTDTSKANSIISSLLSAERTIKDSRDAIVKAQRSIEEKELSLKNLKEGADALAIRAKKIAIQQKEDALASAEQNLADCYVRAPFDGVLAKVDVKRGDEVSGAASVATLITKQKIAQISLNEIDAVKVKAGQRVTLTFDAIEDLNLTGEVTEIDALGTVSQGVVSYDVKISFDTQDERVKPGMSLSAAIVTDIKQDVLMAPNSAVKSQGDTSYVEVAGEGEETGDIFVDAAGGIFLKNPLRRQVVEVGLSNDTSTEIISGLGEGDKIITRTVTAGSSSQGTGQQAPSLFGGGGSKGTGGGMMRIER